MASAEIKIGAFVAKLGSNGKWSHPSQYVEDVLNLECSPSNFGPAHGDPFAAAAAMAAKEFRGEVLLIDMGEPPPAGVIH